MREVLSKASELLYFFGLVSTALANAQKKLNVTSHPVMMCDGTIILDISFEQRSFALKFFLLRLIASSPLLIDAAYAHITTTSISFETISIGVV